MPGIARNLADPGFGSSFDEIRCLIFHIPTIVETFSIPAWQATRLLIPKADFRSPAMATGRFINSSRRRTL
jgi:hypothetical protein